jgi:hypothetical protein
MISSAPPSPDPTSEEHRTVSKPKFADQYTAEEMEQLLVAGGKLTTRVFAWCVHLGYTPTRQPFPARNPSG